MILVATGMNLHGFDRLVRGVDELVKQRRIQEEVFIQIGYSRYEPTACPFMRVVPLEEMERRISGCSVLVTHGGAGLIADGLELGKPVVAVPRLQRYGEHVNDHQMELLGVLEGQGRVVVVTDVGSLPAAIERARALVPRPPESSQRVLDVVDEFLRSLAGQ